MEQGKRRIDRPPALHERIREAVAVAARERLPLFAGGKSMGGRMTSQAQSLAPLADVPGLAIVGFPTHPAFRRSASGNPPQRTPMVRTPRRVAATASQGESPIM